MRAPCSGCDDGGLGFIRSYLTSVGANKVVGARNQLGEWRFILANPSFRRLFCSDSPNKKSKFLHWQSYVFEVVYGITILVKYLFCMKYPDFFVFVVM